MTKNILAHLGLPTETPAAPALAPSSHFRRDMELRLTRSAGSGSPLPTATSAPSTTNAWPASAPAPTPRAAPLATTATTAPSAKCAIRRACAAPARPACATTPTPARLTVATPPAKSAVRDDAAGRRPDEDRQPAGLFAAQHDQSQLAAGPGDGADATAPTADGAHAEPQPALAKPAANDGADSAVEGADTTAASAGPPCTSPMPVPSGEVDEAAAKAASTKLTWAQALQRALDGIC